jgi:hypothetical protein
MRLRLGAVTALVLSPATYLSGCSRQVPPSPAPTSTAISADSLGPLLKSRLGLAPSSLEMRMGQRVSIGFPGRQWADLSDAARFDRAYDVARWVWDSYGAANGIDTISVRLAFRAPDQASDGAPQRTQEFFFYPEQLAARNRPRLGSAR